MRRAGWRGLLVPAVLLGLGVGHAVGEVEPAAAACLPVAGGGALTVEGIGRVVFQELATDRVRDAATFGGRVCLAVDGSDVVFRTERLEVSGLTGPLTLEATGVRVEVPGWTLVAATLRGEPGWAELADVTIVGSDAVGIADTMRLEFASGVLTATALRLVTSSLRLDATTASLDGDVLVADGARVASCDCPPEEAPLRIDAVRVRLDLAAEVSAVVEGGSIIAGRVRWPLGEALVLDATTLADLALPIAIGPDPDRDGAWRIALLAREVAAGALLTAAWTSGDAEQPPRASFGFEARGPGLRLDWRGASDRLSVDLRGDAALGAGWRVEASQRFEAGAIEEPYRDVTVRVARVASSSDPRGRGSAEFGARTALTGQTLDGREVAGPRLGVDARLGWTAPAGTVVPGLEIAAAATAYPGLGAQQTWASVRPGLTVRAGGLLLDATHVARWVSGGSPFSARVDRVGALQRSDVVARWSGVLATDVAFEASATLRYRWDADAARAGRRIGVENLTVRLRAAVPAGEASLGVDVDLALAGRVDPRPGRDAFAAAQVAWTRDRLDVGVRTTLGLEPGGVWRDLTVFAAVPLDVSEAWTLRPYLAVDVLAFTGGAGPWLRGHGLDVTWRTCCGIVELGYRSDAVDGATTHFALLLPVRPLDPARLATLPGAP